MKVTKGLPTAAGWYWFKAGKLSPSPTTHIRAGLWVVVLVSENLRVYFPSAIYNVADLRGWWSERLKEPEGE